MNRKLEEKGRDPATVYEFRNWSNVEDIYPKDVPSSYRDEWGITTPHVALYSGAIAQKQGIEMLNEVARPLAHRKELKPIFCGNGPNTAGAEARDQTVHTKIRRQHRREN